MDKAIPAWLRLCLQLILSPRPAPSCFYEARDAVASWLTGRYPEQRPAAPRGALVAHQRTPYPKGSAGARAYLSATVGSLASSLSEPDGEGYRARRRYEVDELRAGIVLAALDLLERELDADGLLTKTPGRPGLSAARLPCLASGCKREAYRLHIWTGQGRESVAGPHGPYCQDHEEGRAEEWDYCGQAQGLRPACDRWAVRPEDHAGAVFCCLHGGADYEGGSHAERSLSANKGGES